MDGDRFMSSEKLRLLGLAMCPYALSELKFYRSKQRQTGSTSNGQCLGFTYVQDVKQIAQIVLSNGTRYYRSYYP